MGAPRSPESPAKAVTAKDTVIAERFRLVRPIAKGGMGSVWEAVHLGLCMPCALKFIDNESFDREEMVHRFEREARIAALLRSRHVVQILDHGVWNEVPYIAMELLHGETLRARLERTPVLSPEELMPIVRHMCRALRKAHEHGIVHRDLKPDNIHLSHDDDGEFAKVLDFGVAKLLPMAQITGPQTRTGDLLGTPFFMSPEQARGSRTVDARSDLWSLAVIVFRCLTGQFPFVAETFGELVIEICISPIVVPSSLAPVPIGFDAWWAKASAREPEDRFQTASEFLAALERDLGMPSGDASNLGLATPAPAPAPPESSEPPTRKDAPSFQPTMPSPGIDASKDASPLNATAHTYALAASGDASIRQRRTRWALSVGIALTLIGGGIITALSLKPPAAKPVITAPPQVQEPPAPPPTPSASVSASPVPEGSATARAKPAPTVVESRPPATGGPPAQRPKTRPSASAPPVEAPPIGTGRTGF